MFLIRADGNEKIGSGHLMRCLTIAEAAAELAGSRDGIRFVCADDESAEFVRSRGFRAKALCTDYRDMEAELPMWEEMAAESGIEIRAKCDSQGYTAVDTDGLVILADSYYVTDAYLQTLRSYGKVYLMDDMQEHAYPVDGVVNYNVFASRPRYEELYGGREPELFLGGAYAPLRKQFAKAEYRPAERVREVLLTTGGGDAENIADAVMDIVYRPELVYHVLVGRFSPHFESWQSRAHAAQNIRVHWDVQDMAGLMRRCDLALTAGGSTIYELAAVGVPFICFSYAENQEALTEYIGRNDIAGYAGAWHLDRPAASERLAQLFDQFCRDGELRKRCSAAEKKLTDGRGAKRLAEALLPAAV